MAHPSVSLPTLGPAEAAAIVGEPVHAVTPVGQGVRSRVYRVETEEGMVRVVRLVPRGTGRVAREAWVRGALRGRPDAPTLAEVAVHGLPIAQLADVVSMAEMPGATMFAALRTMFEPEARAVYAQWGAGLASIHGVTVQGYGLLDGAGRGAFPTWRAAFEATARASVDEARASPLADLAPEAERVIAELAPATDAVTSARLLHGDAQPMNAHVHRGRIVAFFDFEFASGGDPAYELAYVERLFEPEHAHTVSEADLAERRRAFYEGYARHRPAPAPPAELTRLYRLVHALRGTEFLSVVGPQLAAPARDATTRSMRAAVEKWLRG